MKRTKIQAEETRKLLLKTAIKLFSEKGYTATRLADIAVISGVTRGAIYWHFGNKFNLYCALVESCFQKFIDRIKNVYKSQESPITIIEKLIKEYFTSLEDDEEYRAIEEILFFKTEFSEEFLPLKKHYTEILHDQISRITNLIKRGIKIGEINPEIDPKMTAISLLSFIDGIASNWLFDTSIFSPKKDADKLIKIFLYGIRKK